MRITNKIMQRNNLSNINTNKVYQDQLSTQMSTQKKINRPSDDPVVAIRALRLRSNVTEVTQYYSKNIPDAESWLSVTEAALKNLSEIVTSMIQQSTKGANGDLTTSDRQIILEQLQALGSEVYSTGDADYAGRYVFTGYRTDTPLSFSAATSQKYTITEQLDKSAIDSFTKIQTGKLLDITSANFNEAGTGGQPGIKDISEADVSSEEVYRIRLAYNDCNGNPDVVPCVEYQVPDVDIAGNQKLDADGKPVYIWVKEEATVSHTYDNPDPYALSAQNPDKVYFVPETGEMLLGKTIYDDLMARRDDDATVSDESEIRVTYQKSEWQNGDLRPEHYFYCVSNDPQTGAEIKYNESYLTNPTERQVIEYDVGFNQTIRVNSTADECFKPGIGRSVDDLVASLQEVLDLEGVQATIENALKTATGTDAEILNAQKDAVDKALTLAKDKSQKMFEKGITVFQNYLDDTNLSITNVGTRSSKLELIEKRMQTQKTTFETLKSENEDIDITEVAIQLSSAELTYEAALMATGKVMKTTLLNFI